MMWLLLGSLLVIVVAIAGVRYLDMAALRDKQKGAVDAFSTRENTIRLLLSDGNWRSGTTISLEYYELTGDSLRLSDLIELHARGVIESELRAVAGMSYRTAFFRLPPKECVAE